MRKPFIKDGLNEYLKEEHAVWHMPGHKRKACFGDFLDTVYAWDVTEVPGTDDLYLPEQFLKESLAQLADIYHTCGTFYLLNGATGGIFTAIRACTKPGDHILIARNCHKSVFNAAKVLQLSCQYIKPVWDDLDFPFTQDIEGYIDASDVEKMLQQDPDITALVITSPTYEGVISDIHAIADVAHAHGVYVIVDEAHGAHLPFLNPEYSAIHLGADVVVQSLHKTLPAMTQTALLHVCTEALVPAVKCNLEMFQTSSPSYIMMMSIEEAVCYMEAGDFGSYNQALSNFRKSCTEDFNLKKIHLLTRDDVTKAGAYALDDTRLVFYGETPGPYISELLKKTGLVVCEMAGIRHVVLISTVKDTEKDFDILYNTLKNTDAVLTEEGDRKNDNSERMDLRALVGTTAQAPVYVYPPGSYLVTAGEIFTEEIVDTLLAYKKAGLHIRGI